MWSTFTALWTNYKNIVVFYHIYKAHKMELSNEDYFGKCKQIYSFFNLFTFIQNVLHGKLLFFVSVSTYTEQTNQTN